MGYTNLLWEQRSSILFLTLNRESKLNALNRATLAELHFAIFDALQEKSIRGIIITGAGTKAFAAGADIAELKDLTPDEGTNLSRETHSKVFDLIENSTKPIIAAINGYALGGGLELAMACHIRLASVGAKMGLPELTLGLIPGYGGTQRLPKLVGKSKAFEIILSSEMISADYAKEIGLISYVTEQEELLSRCEDLMKKIVANPPIAIKTAIAAINASEQADGSETEISGFGTCFATAEFKEGISAFLDKRKPNFENI